MLRGGGAALASECIAQRNVLLAWAQVPVDMLACMALLERSAMPGNGNKQLQHAQCGEVDVGAKQRATCTMMVCAASVCFRRAQLYSSERSC